MSIEEYVRLYEYDRSVPLNPGISKFIEKGSYIAYKIYYDSVGGQRVPTIFTVCKYVSPPYPCILFLHGYGGRKEDVIPIADVLSARGYSLLSIDALYHGERSMPGKVLYSPDIDELKANVIQTIIDLRRAIDFLETRIEIDSGRIGYIGGSMGGIFGALLVGVESRVKAAVIIVGGGNIPLMIKTSRHYSVPPIRSRIETLGITYEQLEHILAPIDPINFIHLASPRPLQFHCGRYDDIVPAETQRQLAEKASEPKEVYWYDAGHGLPLEPMASRIIGFLDKYLK
jgi:cephalosporin-C deacetylase-like acetyl esterase